MMQKLVRVPWIYLIILYLIVTHQMGLSMEGVVGYIFMTMSLGILFVEFVKSGDTSVLAFFLDTFYAISGVIIATALLCYARFVLPEGTLTFFHWFGYAIIVGDALFSPTNGFRTALRNFGGPVTHAGG